MLGIQANHKCEVRTPNINNFPLTTTDAAPERGGGTHELADSVTRDHVSDCRSAGMRGEGNRAVGPAASSSSIIILSCSLAPSADSQAVSKHLNIRSSAEEKGKCKISFFCTLDPSRKVSSSRIYHGRRRTTYWDLGHVSVGQMACQFTFKDCRD
jgi:hypothetical protein